MKKEADFNDFCAALDLISKNIDKAAEFLNSGELVAIPTETVYGLAGNIFNDQSIRRIFELKKRPLFNPLIVHIKDIESMQDLVTEIPPAALKLAESFWPGPLTLILPKSKRVPDSITAGKNTVALRVPNHQTTLSLLNKLDFPIAAPSANPFGSISPTRPEHVAEYFPNGLSMTLDGGKCTQGIESTIVGFEQGKPIIYRLGAIANETIEQLVGTITINNQHAEKAPSAPGMLSRHYAPNTKTLLVDRIEDYTVKAGEKVGCITFCRKLNTTSIHHQIILSKTCDLGEAMSNLYFALHKLDKLNLDVIVAERLPDDGLGRSMNDRLLRATK